MNSTLWSLLLIGALISAGAVFVAAEMALVSLRDSQVRDLATTGGKRGETVAQVSDDPNRFLSTVQIGVTLMGFMSAAFGEATLASKLTPRLEIWGVPPKVSGVAATIVITLVISYVTIVLGELTAKRLAIQRATSFALVLAPMVDALARVLRPVIWLLSVSTNLVVRLLGGDPKAGREAMSDEELRGIVAGHESLSDEERQIVDDLFDAGHRLMREVMVPRTEVDFLDSGMPVFKAIEEVADSPHSRYPVTGDSSDDVIGFVHVRDLYDPGVSGRGVRLRELARETLRVPDTAKVLPTLTEMRRLKCHMAIVVDEYGGTAGIVTMEDLVEELIGDIQDEYDLAGSETTRLRGGAIEVDGLLNLEDFDDEVGVELPDGPYETVAGYLAAQLGRLPRIDDEVTVDGHIVRVLELDGRRVSRVRVSLAPQPESVEGGVLAEQAVQAAAHSAAQSPQNPDD